MACAAAGAGLKGTDVEEEDGSAAAREFFFLKCGLPGGEGKAQWGAPATGGGLGFPLFVWRRLG